jgi:hypothetical protein
VSPCGRLAREPVPYISPRFPSSAFEIGRYPGTLAALALPSRNAAAQFAEKKVLTLEIAKKMVAAAESEATRNHLAGVVAVVDDAGG